MPLKISIILPVRNGALVLRRALESLINQQYANCELIVIDGASTDGTQDIITQYSAEVSYWVSEPDGHTYIAFNKGLQKATGDVIGFMNADDWHTPDTLDRVNQAFSDPKLELLGGPVNLYQASTFLGVSKPLREDLWSRECYFQMPVPHIATFIKRSLLDKTGFFDVRYRMAADQDFFCRLLQHKPSCRCLAEPLANVAIGGQTHGFASLWEKYQIACQYKVGLPKRIYRFTRYALLSLITRLIMWAHLERPAAYVLKLLGSRHGAF